MCFGIGSENDGFIFDGIKLRGENIGRTEQTFTCSKSTIENTRKR